MCESTHSTLCEGERHFQYNYIKLRFCPSTSTQAQQTQRHLCYQCGVTTVVYFFGLISCCSAFYTNWASSFRPMQFRLVFVHNHDVLQQHSSHSTELWKRTKSYVKSCNELPIPCTISEFCFFLGWTF